MTIPAAQSVPRIGVVVTTFGAPAYIELQLALLSRYPSLHVLITDDASDQTDALESLATRYNADLFVNDRRLGHLRGDLAGFTEGLRWACDRQLTHLVKFSRRYVPYADWLEPLLNLMESQPTTIGGWCEAHQFFRTEAFAVDVAAWQPSLKHLQNTEWILRGGGDVVERYVYTLARAIAVDHHRPTPFAPWPMLGRTRALPQPGALWHDVNRTADYVKLAQLIGLNLTHDDFEAFRGGYRNAA